MTRIQTLVAALGKLPAYDLKAMTLYQQRHTHMPTEVERKQAFDQLKADAEEIRTLSRSLSRVAPQSARDSRDVWTFSL